MTLQQASQESMLTHEPRVSFIILNWNSFEVTLACLLSLRKLDYNNVEEEHIVGAAAESVTHTDIAARGKSQVGRIPYEPYLGGGFRELVC